MRYKYITIDIATEAGLRKAEKLKKQGEAKLPDGYPIRIIGVNKVMFSIPQEERK